MTDFPTGKKHVSFSEIKNWKECAYRHKLQQIDKINMFSPSPFLDFGTIVHEGCEHFLKTREIDLEPIEEALRLAWEKKGFDEPDNPWRASPPGWYKYEHIDTWVKWAKTCLTDLPAFMEETFPGWSYITAEEQLYELIPKDVLKFKGFIDGVIKTKTKSGKNKAFILDWKTAGERGWHYQKRKDWLIHAQLAMYKNFWSRKHNISPEDIKNIQCGFILLKRGGPPGDSCELLKVSVGPSTAMRADKLVTDMIKTVRKGLFMKNRDSCKYCDYKDTVHCPSGG